MSTCVSRALLHLANLDPKLATLGPIAYDSIELLATGLHLHLTPMPMTLPWFLWKGTFLVLIHSPYAAEGHCIVVTARDPEGDPEADPIIDCWDPYCLDYVPIQRYIGHFTNIFVVQRSQPFATVVNLLTQRRGPYNALTQEPSSEEN